MIRVRTVTVGPLQSNSYLLYDPLSSEGLIIDAGDEPHKILKMLSDTKVKVQRIIATHAHFDHVLAVNDIREALGVEFYIHESDKELLELVGEATLRWLGIRYEGPKPDGFVGEGDEVKVGSVKLNVFHTPGHSPGSISLYSKGTVFTGDTLFAGSIGRTDLIGGDQEAIMKSIREKLYRLPDETTVYPGHGPTTSIGIEKKTNPFVRP